jgi:hypothetical protein
MPKPRPSEANYSETRFSYKKQNHIWFPSLPTIRYTAIIPAILEKNFLAKSGKPGKAWGAAEIRDRVFFVAAAIQGKAQYIINIIK